MAKTSSKRLAPTTRRTAQKSAKRPKKWSAKVSKTSDALDLKAEVFKTHDARKVAKSLKRSSDSSNRRKGTPLQSAMSMLNFYINRAGKNLQAKDKNVLNEAKDELRDLYGKATKKKSNNKKTKI